MKVSLSLYWSLLRRYLGPQRARVAGLGVTLLAAAGLQLAGPQIIRAFIDRATAGEPTSALAWLALLYIGVALLTQVGAVSGTYLSELLAWTATNRMRGDLALHCLRLDMPFHKAHPPGAMIERIDGDVSALAVFFSQFVLRVVGSGLLLVGALAMLYREDWRIGAALTAFALVGVVLLMLVRNFAVPFMAAERAANASRYGMIEERLAGLDDVRANGGGPHSLRRLHQAVRLVFRRETRAAAAGTAAWMTTMVLFTLGYGLALGIGSVLFRAGAVSIGTVFLCFQYTQMLRQPLEQLADQIRELQRAAAGIIRIQQLYRTEPGISDNGTTHLPDGALAVEFAGVTFRYSDGEAQGPGDSAGHDAPGDRQSNSYVVSERAEEMPVPDQGEAAISPQPPAPAGPPGTPATLREVSFQLRPGEVLGLLGHTGSGKTTVSRLLFRLYEPTEGAVCLSGVDLRAIPLDELRRRVAIVTQEVQLFRASLRDNLTMFDQGVPDEQIWAALDDLGLGGWARALPDGLDTTIAGAEGLSAGEAQLLAFARVFLRDPGLVILDEASSRLDPATERLIERAVDKLLHGRSAIIIAHRLHTIQRADSVLILERGAVREIGPREALAADPRSRLSELLRVGLEEVIV